MPPLSIVIPVGPGDTAWRGLVGRLTEHLPQADIVVSAAEPPTPAPRRSGIRWVHGPSGRAAQLNRGIDSAHGERLWLLHADSRPDPIALAAAKRFAREMPERAIGWFDLAFGDDGPGRARLNAAGANLRSRFAQLPFGDQGWMMRRSVVESVGRFDPGFGRGEDLEFVVRATARGIQLVRIGAHLRSSARRYRESGWLTTTLAHAFHTLVYYRKARARLKTMPR